MTDTEIIDAPPPPAAIHADGNPSSSATIGQLAGALAKAQGLMDHAMKDHTGTVKHDNGQYTYNYADLASIIDACRPALSSNGISFVQRTLETTDIAVRVETILMHESGEWMSGGVLYMPVEGKKNTQAYGSALTYTKRYSIAALLGIATEDDDAMASSQPANSGRSQVSAVTSSPGAVLWPFGELKGTLLADVPDRDLKYMVSREIKDDNFKAKNIAMRDACQSVLDSRAGSPEPVAGQPLTVAQSGELHDLLREAGKSEDEADAAVKQLEVNALAKPGVYDRAITKVRGMILDAEFAHDNEQEDITS